MLFRFKILCNRDKKISKSQKSLRRKSLNIFLVNCNDYDIKVLKSYQNLRRISERSSGQNSRQRLLRYLINKKIILNRRKFFVTDLDSLLFHLLLIILTVPLHLLICLTYSKYARPIQLPLFLKGTIEKLNKIYFFENNVPVP